MSDEKNKEIKEVMKELNKKYQEVDSKEDLVVDGISKEIESFDTNCYSLNDIFGCGGLPKGRLIEMFGSQASGKSTMAMFIVGQLQKSGGRALWIDMEHVFSSAYAKKLGVDTDKLVYAEPMSGEAALDVIEKMVGTGAYDIVVLDSVAALVAQKELDNEIEDITIALLAKMMSRHLRVISGPAAKNKTSIIYINQTRDNLMQTYGNKITTTGGKALKFYSSVRLDVKATSKIKDKDEHVIGNHLRIYAEKNKCGLPFRAGEIDLYFDKGIDVVGDLFDVAVLKNIIGKAGFTYTYGDFKLGAGRDNAKTILESHPEMIEEIKTKLK